MVRLAPVSTGTPLASAAGCHQPPEQHQIACFSSLTLHWRPPESGDLWCKSRQLKRRFDPTLRAPTSTQKAWFASRLIGTPLASAAGCHQPPEGGAADYTCGYIAAQHLYIHQLYNPRCRSFSSSSSLLLSSLELSDTQSL